MTDLKNLTPGELCAGLDAEGWYEDMRAEIRRRLEEHKELLASYCESYCEKGHPKNFQYGDAHGHFGCAACAMERLPQCEAELLAGQTRIVLFKAIIKNQIQVTGKLSECLLKVAELVKSWKHGNEGAHLLRIRDLVGPFMAVEIDEAARAALEE